MRHAETNRVCVYFFYIYLFAVIFVVLCCLNLSLNERFSPFRSL